MTRSILPFIVFLALYPSIAKAESKNDYLGKTAYQVVALGRTKWFDLYTSKHGHSTMAMSSAEGLFGEAAKTVNDVKFQRLPKLRQAQVTELRTSLMRIGRDSVTLGMVLTGGGTLWTSVSAGVLADVEQVVSQVLGTGEMRSKDKEAHVLLLLDQLDMAIQGNELEIQEDMAGLGLTFAQVSEISRRFRRSISATLSRASKESAKDHSVLVTYMKKVTKRALSGFSS